MAKKKRKRTPEQQVMDDIRAMTTQMQKDRAVWKKIRRRRRA